ncbi:unnamed protein product [Chrysoparadoxa australica]
MGSDIEWKGIGNAGDSFSRSDSDLVSREKEVAGGGSGLTSMVTVHKSRARKFQRKSSRDVSAQDLATSGATARDEALALLSATSPRDKSYSAPQPSINGSKVGNDLCPKTSNWGILWQMQKTKVVNVLFVFLPIAQLSIWQGWGDTWIFVTNFLAMVPLASLLGDFTESLADHLGQTAGGLLNASFGNAPELVFSAIALRADQMRVVQASLMGSVLSNILLVLGSSFFFGGLFSGKKEQKYNATSAVGNTSMLLMSSLALFAVSPIAEYYKVDNDDELFVSRVLAVFMLLMYVQLMIFQFGTHSYMFVDDDSDDDDAEEEDKMTVMFAMCGLAAVTLGVALFSENLVGAIDGFTEQQDLSKTFVGLILIPIIGNVVEHIVAVTVAVKDKMELSLGISVGSACQVSMFVIPFSVIMGWFMDHPLTLNFPRFEIKIYLVCILIVSHLVTAGSSNWLAGSLLITCYFIVALAFWFERVLDYQVP